MPKENATKFGSANERERESKRLRRFVTSFFLILSLILQNFLFLVNPVYASTSTWDFSTSSNYTYDDTKIEFSSNKAQLKATANWYDTAWTRRKTITIDNTSNSNILSNYQVFVTTTYDSDMKTDFSDIRFTDSTGIGLLYFWREDYTSSSIAHFWVKVPTITASSTTTLYMYYGNSSAGDVSDGVNTFAFFDNLTSTTGWSTFGSNVTWSIANDATRGNVFDATITSANDTGIYKSLSMPSSYVAQLYAKDMLVDSLGSWGGPLMDMPATNSWYRPGFSIEQAQIQIRDDNNGTPTNYSHTPTATASANTWLKTQSIFKNATQLSSSSNFTPLANSATQGLATDGTYIYTSGNYILAKYDRSGNLITSITRPSDNNHFGGMQIVGTKLFAVIFDYQTGPTDKTYIYSWNLDLTGETQVADLTSVTGNGGNGLAYNNGYWIVGETGGATSNFNQHFYVFDSNWNLVKTIQSPYYKYLGVQDTAFKGNSLYATEHDGTILVFTWDAEALELRLADNITPPATYDEGIAYDSVNNVFYIQNTSTGKIETVTFPELATKRIIYSIPDTSNSYGVVYHDFTPRTQTYFGIGAWRSQRFSQLTVRQYSFPEPVTSTGSEVILYPTDNPTINPTTANAQAFTSLSGFSETATKNGGQIKYQVSNDSGTIWYWWNGSAWTTTVSGYTEASLASDINSNISTFPVGSKSFLFKAYLNSNGTQLVQLDSIDLTYVNDITGPTISIVSSTPTSTGATITWTTNENASSKIDYGLTTSYGTSTTETDTSTRVTTHSVALSSLSSCTTYHYRVRSIDTALNETIDSDNTFITAGCTSSSNSSSNNSSSTSTSVCSDTAPGTKAPWLYGAIAQDSGSVLLYFTEADNPVNKYVLEYGTKSGDYPYGVQDMGVNSRGQMTFLVKSLSPNTTYYFRIRGGNGCATGTWSNEISAKTKGLVSFNQLEITQSQLEPQPVTEIPSNTSCQTYVVKSGDTLWAIAKNLLGDGNLYKEIVEQNKDTYSSLETSNNLRSGWELKINCGKQATTEAQKTPETQTQSGYDVKVKVIDTNKNPVEGSKVTIHSKVQETTTNKDGIAEFKNVEAGDHKVLIAYNNFEGEQSVNLTGDVKEFDLNVTVQQKVISLSPLAYGIIGIMGLVIIVLIVLLIKNKRKG